MRRVCASGRGWLRFEKFRRKAPIVSGDSGPFHTATSALIACPPHHHPSLVRCALLCSVFVNRGPTGKPREISTSRSKSTWYYLEHLDPSDGRWTAEHCPSRLLNDLRKAPAADTSMLQSSLMILGKRPRYGMCEVKCR
ncbi:hypothetical protein OH76DRAFT_1256704 [Lentinus brumalis]|uniref:Uncharacterized protein n=1 Tax=Lentinus brumalis TaxID=2498619 RepID=A0A371CRJ9_9APHY|nr:hypothetical protein OH76DRAFT_1256704 [Polyporus brumalis]